MKILIFGASGSGTTTLGEELAKQTGYIQLDADAYYWKKTPNPYTVKVSPAERQQNLQADFDQYARVIVSGSLVSWGKEWETAFDLAIFIYLEPALRMKRLQNRELKRYGEELHSNLQKQEQYEAFIHWARQYDDPNFEGRSLKLHQAWMKRLSCPVLQIDGSQALADKVQIVQEAMKTPGI